MTHGPDMLRPLRDSSPSEPELLLGARLLAHTQPLAKSEARKRRVWNALTTGHNSRLGFRLTALHVAFASVLCAAVSSAAVGGYYVKHHAAETAAAATTATGAPRAAAKARGQAHAKMTAPRPSVAAPTADAAVGSDLDKSSPARPTPAHAKPEASVVKRAAPEADAELLVEAMRARRSGDARRVSELADEYRARHPQGALQEEALILSIESAVAQHAPNTSALAREYLRRFPRGRFALQARRALDRNAR